MLLCAAGCDLSGPEQKETTERATVETAVPAAAEAEDDVALPKENEGGSTTAPVITSTTVVPTTAFQRSAIMQELANTPEEPEPPTTAPEQEPETQAAEENPAEQPEQTQTTTTKPEETTKAPSAELLERSVLKHIQSGNYTITVSAFGKDHKNEDKIYKIMRGGETAYYVTIPAAKLTFKVFPSDGKYYLATNSQYCELTRSQYDHLCSTLNNAFCDFTALRNKYQQTETVRQGLRKYTREDYSVGGKALSLWYSGGALFKMEMETSDGTESLPTTVSGAADSKYYTLGSQLTQSEYSEMESLVQLAELFFGA